MPSYPRSRVQAPAPGREQKTEGRCRIFSAHSVQTAFYTRPLIRFLRTGPFCGCRVVFTKWSFYIGQSCRWCVTKRLYKLESMLHDIRTLEAHIVSCDAYHGSGVETSLWINTEYCIAVTNKVIIKLGYSVILLFYIEGVASSDSPFSLSFQSFSNPSKVLRIGKHGRL